MRIMRIYFCFETHCLKFNSCQHIESNKIVFQSCFPVRLFGLCLRSKNTQRTKLNNGILDEAVLFGGHRTVKVLFIYFKFLPLFLILLCGCLATLYFLLLSNLLCLWKITKPNATHSVELLTLKMFKCCLNSAIRHSRICVRGWCRWWVSTICDVLCDLERQKVWPK